MRFLSDASSIVLEPAVIDPMRSRDGTSVQIKARFTTRAREVFPIVLARIGWDPRKRAGVVQTVFA
jgi:hypothetical protein